MLTQLLGCVHKPPVAPPPDNIDILAQTVAQHRAAYRQSVKGGTGERGKFPLDDQGVPNPHRVDTAGPMPMLIDGKKLLIGTQSKNYRPPDIDIDIERSAWPSSILHKPSHAHHSMHHMADIHPPPPPPPPPGAPPPAEEDILLGRAVRNRHHAKKKKHHGGGGANERGGGGVGNYMTAT